MSADAAALPHAQPITASMKAIVQPQYGSPDVFRVDQVDRPAPESGEVLVEVHAASIGAGDVHLMKGEPYLVRAMGFGLLRPRQPVPGMCFAGRIVEVGEAIAAFSVGDEVYGEVERGAFAEYVAVPEKRLAKKPKNLDFAAASTVPDSGTTALQGLRDVAQVREGQRGLVNGASGGVGTFAVQVARALGAEVTAVCSTRNLEQARALGAVHVIDYTAEDFVGAGQKYDVVFDVVGNRTVEQIRSVLVEDGTYVTTAGQVGGPWFGPVFWLLGLAVRSMFRRQKLKSFVAAPNTQDLDALRTLIEAGKVHPVVERTFPLADARTAMQHMVAGHARGKTVLQVRGAPAP